MKKRLVLGMIALSLASGFLVFGKPSTTTNEDLVEACTPGCCESDTDDSSTKCCQDTELCCE